MVIDKWLNDIAGNFRIKDESINVQPITRARNEDEKTLIKLADKLCLSPDARNKLGVAYATYSLARSLMNVNIGNDD
jgi:phage terminase small subunit